MEMLDCTVESRPGAATLYLGGVLSSAGALRVLERCTGLGPGVRHLVVDCRGVRLYDASALGALAIVLEVWREVRGGDTRLVSPGPASTGGTPAAFDHRPPARRATTHGADLRDLLVTSPCPGRHEAGRM